MNRCRPHALIRVWVLVHVIVMVVQSVAHITPTATKLQGANWHERSLCCGRTKIGSGLLELGSKIWSNELRCIIGQISEHMEG